MCGIVGYVGQKPVVPLLIDALQRLEYRGYDSVGIAVIASSPRRSRARRGGSKKNSLFIYKDKGKVAELKRSLPKEVPSSTIGVGHTRWATCGVPSKVNAHPHVDCKQMIAVVHNGIIENYVELKEELEQAGHKFISDTDTEVLPHLIEACYSRAGSIDKAVQDAIEKVRGTFAIAVLHVAEPTKLIVARAECPLIIGIGIDENFIASDIPAILKYTNRVIYLDNNEFGVVTSGDINIYNFDGELVDKRIHKVPWTIEAAQKGGYEHFMLKEIYEQPEAIRQALLGRVPELKLDGMSTTEFDSICIVACGTSYHAGLVGKYVLEQLTSIPVQVELASEYRYSAPTALNSLLLAITQSGETADTLAAVREARRRGLHTLAITNVIGSTVTRETDEYILTHAGPEIGVAATKTFISQLIALYLLALKLGLDRRTISHDEFRTHSNILRKLPRHVSKVLDNTRAVKRCARALARAEHVFFVGRNINYPVALEGALKLKEISYIHAEGYAAGELKHGPLALLSQTTPVIVITAKDHTYDKILGNIGEIAARNSPVIAVGVEGDRELDKYADTVLRVPDVLPLYSPVPISVLLQLLAYYTAKERKCEIDTPRNLAKSVTVE
jgi:glucosamine--fructose-6-phosphate aminotransferase (isomerizing)